MKNILLFILSLSFLSCSEQKDQPKKVKEEIITNFFKIKTGEDINSLDENTKVWLDLSKIVKIPELSIEYYFPQNRNTGIDCLFIFNNKTNNTYFRCNANDNVPNVNDLRKNEIIKYNNNIHTIDVDSIAYFREKSYPEEAIADYLNDAFLDSLVSFEKFKLLLDRYYGNRVNQKSYFDINDDSNIDELMQMLNKKMSELSSDNEIEKNKKDKLLRDINYLLLPPITSKEVYKLIYRSKSIERFRVLKLMVYPLRFNYAIRETRGDKFYYSIIVQDISLYTEY
ncbi:MAG: hypothetical protein JNK77_14315 [Saprospiraceae bacterium]|nr:hypothetical protein [Saprospiraceae bacterium]